MNAPGWFHVTGCGDAKTVEDIGWIVDELVRRNCAVHVFGCAANEIARYFDKAEGKFIFEKYGSTVAARCLTNQGGCSAASLVIDQSMKWAREGPHICHYANFAPIADDCFCVVSQPLIIWGALPERMWSLATAWVRSGSQVIIGPASAFSGKRFLLGNKWDWEKWWTYIMMAVGYTGDDAREKRWHEPGPKHMLIPVETKEEALTTAIILCQKAGGVYDMRQPNLAAYIEYYTEAFGEYPDDWHLYVRVDLDLPLRQKPTLLKKLREEQGWEIERMTVKKRKLPDGRLASKDEYDQFLPPRFFLTRMRRTMAKPLYFRTGGKKPEKV
jgi:CO dehydrogenase/acetyl-CoA synthase alpha subunit